jgi:hypothetical protein
MALYVDDLIFMGNNSRMMEEFKGAMMKEFKVNQHEKDIFIS